MWVIAAVTVPTVTDVGLLAGVTVAQLMVPPVPQLAAAAASRVRIEGAAHTRPEAATPTAARPMNARRLVERPSPASLEVDSGAVTRGTIGERSAPNR